MRDSSGSPAADFAIYRIVGNSLPPRHAAGNNISVTRFILDNEPRFARSRRVWVINRVVDAAERDALHRLFGERGEDWIETPFQPGQHFAAFLDVTGIPFAQRTGLTSGIGSWQANEQVTEWAIRNKSQLLVGLNAARNMALAHGRATARWTLVLDGGVMFDREGWERFTSAVERDAQSRIAVINMIRLYEWGAPIAPPTGLRHHKDNVVAAAAAGGRLLRRAALHVARHGLSAGTARSAAQKLQVTRVLNSIRHATSEEPQLAFHRESTEVFDERLRYGNRNKAELLSRLGVEGPWQYWSPAHWDVSEPLPAPSRDNVVQAGYVLRLPPNAAGVDAAAQRYRNRFMGVISLSFECDARLALANLESQGPALPPVPGAEETLHRLAARHLQRDGRLIADKPKPGPSGNAQDYFTLSPYLAHDGRYVDGVPQHGTGEQRRDWARFDRRSLQAAMTRSYVLAHCGDRLDDPALLAEAARILCDWFVTPGTRMTPSARYAQLRPGNTGENHIGLIEMREIAHLCHSVPLLRKHGALGEAEEQAIRTWLVELRASCAETGALGRALAHDNNIGTWTAATFAAIDLFTGETRRAFEAVWLSPLRLGRQLLPLSIEVHEIERSRPLHYCLFNLSAWWWMCRVASRFGVDLRNYRGIRGESIGEALQFCALNRQGFADYAAQAEAHDRWIAQLEMLFGMREMAEPVMWCDDPDLGLPPIAFGPAG